MFDRNPALVAVDNHVVAVAVGDFVVAVAVGDFVVAVDHLAVRCRHIPVHNPHNHPQGHHNCRSSYPKERKKVDNG